MVSYSEAKERLPNAVHIYAGILPPEMEEASALSIVDNFFVWVDPEDSTIRSVILGTIDVFEACIDKELVA